MLCCTILTIHFVLDGQDSASYFQVKIEGMNLAHDRKVNGHDCAVYRPCLGEYPSPMKVITILGTKKWNICMQYIPYLIFFPLF